MKTVTIRYTNHRGETADRVIEPHHGGLWFGKSAHHPGKGPAWYLDAICFDRDSAVRSFALADILAWKPGEPEAPAPGADARQLALPGVSQ